MDKLIKQLTKKKQKKTGRISNEIIGSRPKIADSTSESNQKSLLRQLKRISWHFKLEKIFPRTGVNGKQAEEFTWNFLFLIYAFRSISYEMRSFTRLSGRDQSSLCVHTTIWENHSPRDSNFAATPFSLRCEGWWMLAPVGKWSRELGHFCLWCVCTPIGNPH